MRLTVLDALGNIHIARRLTLGESIAFEKLIGGPMQDRRISYAHQLWVLARALEPMSPLEIADRFDGVSAPKRSSRS